MITVRRRQSSGRLITMAAIAAVATSVMTFGVAWAVIPAPAPGSSGPGSLPASSDAGQGSTTGFETVPESGAPGRDLPEPPVDAVITSIAFRKDLPPVLPGSRAPWWRSAVAPRIRAITQFDHGRLKGVNCTMAAGAMLAALAYGIVTTGSQLRALQGDQSGGTGFWDLNNAMEAGWGVRFARGRLTPLQFRALLWSGAGAAIHVDYGLIGPAYSYQPRFKGAHSIYLDAFRDGPNGPEYFVMDPLGPTQRGYEGTWWPASMVEAAAMSFGNQRIVTAWAYASGIRLIGKPPKLPVDSYPIQDKPKRGEKPKPADPPTPETDPIPPGPTPDQNAPKTETETPTTPADLTPNTGGVKAGFVSIRSLLSACVVTLRPAFCPIGLPGEYPLLVASFSPPPLMVPSKLDLLYADSPQPGVERTFFTGPPGIAPSLSYWPTTNGSPGAVSQATVEAVTLDGQQVWMATFPIESGSYQFVASGAGISGAGISEVATVTVAGP